MSHDLHHNFSCGGGGETNRAPPFLAAKGVRLEGYARIMMLPGEVGMMLEGIKKCVLKRLTIVFIIFQKDVGLAFVMADMRTEQGVVHVFWQTHHGRMKILFSEER